MGNRSVSKGSSNNGNIFDSFRRKLGEGTGITDWAGADHELLVRLVVTAADRGGAVRFGYTRDGGAYALGLYFGTETATKYCRPQEDLDDFLRQWLEFFEEQPSRGGKSPDQG